MQYTVASWSWLASFHCLVIRSGVLEKLQLYMGYQCRHFAAADLAFQVFKNGGTVRYEPNLIDYSASDAENSRVPERDLMNFTLRFLGKSACFFAFPLASVRVFFKQAPPTAGPFRGIFDLTLTEGCVKIGEYTAIIPTINRYAYLKKAVHSLLKNRRPPAEVIIVDQTPEALRVPGYYDEFDPDIVKVIFIDRAGQSTARNTALQNASHKWILFFDDDSEAWEDMIEEHIWLLEHSYADVSTGVSLAPWKDRSYIPEAINFYHIATVLDTGNCMMRREIVERVGMLDRAFDKGSGADDNLGKRLHLSGMQIVFNPKAIRTHHKAPMGGLREHGAWWKIKGTYFGPFPLPTESYDFLTFYPKKFYIRLCLYRLLRSFRRSNLLMNTINVVLFPFKVFASYKLSKKLMLTKHD
jgi:glycosyltransferase involved in cell wall biosynthesis